MRLTFEDRVKAAVEHVALMAEENFGFQESMLFVAAQRWHTDACPEGYCDMTQECCDWQRLEKTVRAIMIAAGAEGLQPWS